MDDAEMHDHLMYALVGARHRVLYDNSAQFKASVQSLVTLLPLWVDFMANQATLNEKQRYYDALKLDMTVTSPFTTPL